MTAKKPVRFNCAHAKTIIRQIVGRMHVGATDEEVAKYAVSRLKPSASEATKRAVGKCAIKVHHENRGLFRRVMR